MRDPQRADQRFERFGSMDPKLKRLRWRLPRSTAFRRSHWIFTVVPWGKDTFHPCVCAVKSLHSRHTSS
jgi:hypothetical protein